MNRINSLVLSVLFLWTLSSCNRNKETFTVTQQPITESVYASGKVFSEDQYQVYSEATGILKRQLVQEGESIKMGQTLFEIENASGVLSTKNAELSERNALVSANQNKMKELQLQWNQAQDKLTNDSVQYKRQQALWNQGIGSKLELEMKQLSYENSKRIKQSASINILETMRQLKLNEQLSKNTLALNQTLGGNFQVKSAFEGTLFKVYKKVGELVSPQVPIAVIGKGENFYLELEVDEEDIAKIQLGQKIIVSIESYQDRAFEATVSQIIPILNEKSRTFTIKATFLIPPKKIFPNQNIEANIVISSKKEAIVIPIEYIDKSGQVIMKNGDKRNVKTGLKDFKNIEILKGLNLNEEITLP